MGSNGDGDSHIEMRLDKKDMSESKLTEWENPVRLVSSDSSWPSVVAFIPSKSGAGLF